MIARHRSRHVDSGRVDALGARKLLRGIGILTTGALVSGCVSEPSAPLVEPVDGVPADVAIPEFVITVAAAESLADNCGDYGIRRNYGTSDEVTDSFLRGMLRQGYAPAEIERAADSLSPDAVANDAVASFKRLGVPQGDLDALCRVGLKEISDRTPVGLLLRVGT